MTCGCASNLGRRERSYKVIKQAAPFRCPSGGDTVAGKFLSRDLKGRLPKAAPTRELSTAGCTGRPRLQGHARHSEDKDASCADQAAPRPVGPLARAGGSCTWPPLAPPRSPGAGGSPARPDAAAGGRRSPRRHACRRGARCGCRGAPRSGGYQNSVALSSS